MHGFVTKFQVSDSKEALDARLSKAVVAQHSKDLQLENEERKAE